MEKLGETFQESWDEAHRIEREKEYQERRFRVVLSLIGTKYDYDADSWSEVWDLADAILMREPPVPKEPRTVDS